MTNVRRVGILTAGGLAPCLSSAIGGLIQRYTDLAPEIEIYCYKYGFMGLLQGDRIIVTPEIRAQAALLHQFGGSPIGNSRVKLTNVKDCLKRGLIKEGQDPQEVAAAQLVRDGIDVLHTIGGDDTNTSAAELAVFLAKTQRDLTVIGLPKTVDNDVMPIHQTLGAWTAAEQGARFFENVVAEHSANPRMLLIHEVMGRNCGWLTAATTQKYTERLQRMDMLPAMGVRREALAVHGVYLPEMSFDIAQEAIRLRGIMDTLGCVNLFVSEGAGVASILDEMKNRGEAIPTDAFGHVKLDQINPGKWFGSRFADMLGAEKTLVQKSGYFARSAPANDADLRLIGNCVDLAVECALRGESGVIGHDVEHEGRLRAIEFHRIKGGKHFDVQTPWFRTLLQQIGQPYAQ